MKREFLIIVAALLLIGCTEDVGKSDTKDDNSSNELNEDKKDVVDDVVYSQEESIEASAIHSIQGQWDDIVFQVGTGELSNLDMYVDFYAENFSEEEWNYIDLSAPEYAEAFGQYDSFEDLPEADYVGPGVKVVQVYFEFVDEGITYESATMIYLEIRDGLIWIIGSEMVG